MERLKQIWYFITYYLPRPLPKTDDEYLEMKSNLQAYYAIDDTPEVWAVVAAQVQHTSHPTKALYKSYGRILNAVKRIQMNGIAEVHKREAYRAIEKKREEFLAKEMVDVANGSEVSDGSPDIPRDLQRLS